MTYYAVMLQKGLLTGKLIQACGSYANIKIDGRLSFENAEEVARDYFKKECNFKNTEYHGFQLAKGNGYNCLDNAKYCK